MGQVINPDFKLIGDVGGIQYAFSIIKQRRHDKSV
jgi:hypothetical protein